MFKLTDVYACEELLNSAKIILSEFKNFLNLLPQEVRDEFVKTVWKASGLTKGQIKELKRDYPAGEFDF